MTEGIFTHFTKTVDDYNTVADKVVIKNNELHEQIVVAIPGSPSLILDLGSGTGHGMKLLNERFPDAMVYGIDFSPKMISQATSYLKGGNFKLFKRNFIDINFEKTYDVIVSAVAIHNITHEQKKVLFAKIFAALKPGGLFINGDFVEGETEEEQEKYESEYRAYLNDNLSGHELRVWLHHAFEEDMPMKLSEQEHILKEIGFSSVDVTWKVLNEVVYVAKK